MRDAVLMWNLRSNGHAKDFCRFYLLWRHFRAITVWHRSFLILFRKEEKKLLVRMELDERDKEIY